MDLSSLTWPLSAPTPLPLQPIPNNITRSGFGASHAARRRPLYQTVPRASVVEHQIETIEKIQEDLPPKVEQTQREHASPADASATAAASIPKTEKDIAGDAASAAAVAAVIANTVSAIPKKRPRPAVSTVPATVVKKTPAPPLPKKRKTQSIFT